MKKIVILVLLLTLSFALTGNTHKIKSPLGFSGGELTNPTLAPNGTLALPAYSFASDPDTGFFLQGAAQIRLSLGGSLVAIWDVTNYSASTTRTFLLRHATAAGAAAPTYSFVGDNNTGMYSDVADELGFSTGATEKLRISTVIRIIDSGAKPTCVAGIRGALWYEAGGAGVADTLEACGKSTGDTYSWQAVATF